MQKEAVHMIRQPKRWEDRIYKATKNWSQGYCRWKSEESLPMKKLNPRCLLDPKLFAGHEPVVLGGLHAEPVESRLILRASSYPVIYHQLCLIFVKIEQCCSTYCLYFLLSQCNSCRYGLWNFLSNWYQIKSSSIAKGRQLTISLCKDVDEVTAAASADKIISTSVVIRCVASCKADSCEDTKSWLCVCVASTSIASNICKFLASSSPWLIKSVDRYQCR